MQHLKNWITTRFSNDFFRYLSSKREIEYNLIVSGNVKKNDSHYFSFQLTCLVAQDHRNVNKMNVFDFGNSISLLSPSGRTILFNLIRIISQFYYTFINAFAPGKVAVHLISI